MKNIENILCKALEDFKNNDPNTNNGLQAYFAKKGHVQQGEGIETLFPKSIKKVKLTSFNRQEQIVFLRDTLTKML